ncbi:helix-turn-helix domain-containing protein [Aquimarina sp. 2201CG14-23]|uniref:helix-turn-helix domain-containing protein n=1 Tax=Aquimarina mycalae TaxID=3040073 RepID=UPI002477D17E|nr:helix-turn-helix domain-containing protein [Aquimarina sp. 2201CG14-23]MDH7447337.1 helix-turn-helix domain-containing protein [Aquimarina sp. 2201CG14-23]
MNHQFSLFDLLILIGIIQGIITGVLLLNSKKNKRSNKYLALALFSFCFLSTKPLLHTLQLWDTKLFRFFPNAIELILSPLIYFYIRSLVNPKFHFKTKFWLHFVPFFLSQTYAFIVYFSALRVNDFSQKDSIAKNLHFNDIKQLDEYVLLISLALYLFYGYKELINYKKWLDNTTSDSSFPDFKWLKDIFGLSTIIGVFLVINHSLDIFLDLKSRSIIHYDLLMLFISFVIYYLGLKGYLQPDFSFIRSETNADNKTDVALSVVKVKEIKVLLSKAMEEDKVFLNPKLTIKELSAILNVPQREVSICINKHFKLSFREFINNYRVEEVKSKLKDKDFSHMSILGIALECGFNSEASFYRVFKKNTGISPKEYLQQ